MKVAIVGDRNITDYSLIEKAIKQSMFNVTEIVSGGARGVDSLAKEWAEKNKIAYKEFPALWNDVGVEGALVKVNKWGKEYNARAGFQRNEQIAKYSDAAIALQPNGPTNGTQDTIKQVKKLKKQLHIYEKPEEDYEYQF